MKTRFYPEEAKSNWDAVEVNPVFEDENGNCDVVDEGQESYWSVYLHQVEGGVKCIADLPTKDLANDFSKLIKEATNSIVK